ncbi:MAG: cobalamin biosynthesis protein CbiM [Spirochaetes bacterium DG_61]|jgi:cobalt/nickel transport system permease protein|nr:MAG: cobalamin biosynthesis protein CbiM [Spirochaetes bacterium DG_61]
MHISEGVLTPQVLVAGAAVAAAGTAVGLKKMDYEKIPKVAVLTAAFFVASLIHVPIGPTSVHLTLNGLLGLLLGWAAFPAILIGLLLQALLFQFGGLTVLGVNAVNMGVPALIVWLLFGYFIKKDNTALTVIFAFLAGAVAVLLSILFTAFSLVCSGEEFTGIAKVMVVAHLPVVFIEGVVNVFIVTLLKKVKPEILEFSRAVS